MTATEARSKQIPVPGRETRVRDEAKAIIKRRRNKAIATILDAKERSVDQLVDADVAEALRKVVLDEINTLCDIVFAVMESVAKTDVELNQLYFSKLDELLTELRGDHG